MTGKPNAMQSKRQKGIDLNKLLQYKAIQDCYLQYKTDDIPTTVIYKKYIYPRFFISRNTIHNFSNTNK